MVALREQLIQLDAGTRFGRHIPSKACGVVLTVLPDLARQATALAFAHSPAPGRPPRWLMAASDLRVLSVAADEASGRTTVRYEAPTLGSAAQDVYAQELIPGMEHDFPRPSPDATALDLIASLFSDLHAEAADSPRLDPTVLETVARLGASLHARRGYDVLSLDGHQGTIRLTPEACARAKSWRRSTPEPRTVSIEGKLDMLWDSVGSFALLLDDQCFLPGSFAHMSPDQVKGLWRQRVTVIGRVVYRPNGKPLRLEAEAIEPCLDANPIFSLVPEPVHSTGRPINPSQHLGRNGLADLAGMLADGGLDDAGFDAAMRDSA
jgi:hypothetical protein